MDIEQIYSICGIITNISYVPIFLLLILSGSYKQYKAFTVYIAMMAIWGYADYKMGLTEDYMPLWRLYNFCNVFNGYLFYIFSNEITKKYNKKTIIIAGVLCIFFLILNYYNNILLPDSLTELTGYELMKDIIWYDIFIVYYCSLLMLGTWWIYKYFKGEKVVRNLILFGCISTIIGDAYSYGTVYFESLYDFPYVAYIICFLPYSVTYLVFKHRLFDARFILLRMLEWIFIIGMGGVIGAIIYAGFRNFGFNAHFDVPLMFMLIVGFMGVSYLSKSRRVHAWFQLSDAIGLEQGVSEFLTSNAVYTSSEELLENINTALKGGLKINNAILINREDLGKYPALCEALKYTTKNARPISMKETKTEVEQNRKKIRYVDELNSLGELCIPIYIEQRLAYLLVLPEKKSQAAYWESEKKTICLMQAKIALSLQILEYNQSLRDEVERQTHQINEQKKELEASYKKLEALDHEKDVFMNMAAHELRTPLTIMRGYADMMCTGVSGELNPLQQKLSTNILKGGESLLSLVNDLLDLSRIDAGKMELHYEECDIRETTHDIFENFSGLMDKKDMKFTLEETLDTSKIFWTDKAKLTLIYNNLLSNAYKYTPEHGTVTWKTTTEMEGDTAWLVFSVGDSGVGIPAEEIPHVFDRFASISTHNDIAATIQSTGLGLSIVKKIIIGMGGTVTVESVVKQGTTFTVKLPYEKPEGGVKKL